MTRIENKFKTLRTQGEKALVIYITAGDPSLELTKEIVLGLDAAGVDCLEIGVPFSDPTADGPIIQAASQRALKNGTTLSAILDMIESIRTVSEIPIVLFGYYNPILSYGTERFAARAQEAGVDGILVVDLPPEESHELRQYTDLKGIDCISLIAPTTSTDRMKMITSHASGFLYYISITGVTGTAKPQVDEVAQDIKRIRTATALPLVVGFGISTPQQAQEISPYADGIVIGSAVVRMIEEHGEKFDLVTQIAHYAKEIKAASQPANPPKNR